MMGRIRLSCLIICNAYQHYQTCMIPWLNCIFISHVLGVKWLLVYHHYMAFVLTYFGFSSPNIWHSLFSRL